MNRIIAVTFCLAFLWAGVTAVTLTPGSGFTGNTTQPPAIGADREIVIARFDVVPFDEFTDTFNVGVVAFHYKGVDRVEFSFQNGPWTAINSMTYNPQSKVVEYWATLDASSVSDGKVEVRAIAYPMTGIPRVLSVVLFANHGRSLPKVTVNVDSVNGVDDSGRDGLTKATAWKTIPYAFQQLDTSNTIDGAIIALQPGSYGLGGYGKTVLNQRWITIQPADGVTNEQALIDQSTDGSKRFNLNYVRVKAGVQIPHACNGNATVKSMVVGGGGARQLWFSDTFIRGPGYNTLSDNWLTLTPPPYYTELELYDYGVVNNGVLNLNGPIIRNVYAHDFSNDMFDAEDSLIVNAKVEKHHIVKAGNNYFDKCTNSNYTGGDQHADVFQLRVAPVDNVIYYNMDVRDYEAQTLFFQDNVNYQHSNQAIVNCIFDPNEQNSAFFSQITPGFRHFIMAHVFLDQYLSFRVDTFVNTSACGTNLFKANIFKMITGSALVLGELDKIIHFEDNHFLSTTCYLCWGPRDTTTFTVGANISLDFDTGPMPDSPLLNRVQNLFVPTDVRNLPRTSPTTIGPLVPGVPPTPEAPSSEPSSNQPTTNVPSGHISSGSALSVSVALFCLLSFAMRYF